MSTRVDQMMEYAARHDVQRALERLVTHTSGEWTVESDGTTVSFGNQAVIVSPAPDGAPIEEARANARLIAAAPDLLSALDLFVRMFEDGSVSIAETVANGIRAFERATGTERAYPGRRHIWKQP